MATGRLPDGAKQSPRLTSREGIRRNGLWLVLPVLVANLVLAAALPGAYASDEGVPGWLLVTEWALRIAVVAIPLFRVVSVHGRAGRTGVALYSTGLALYAASWALVIAQGDAVLDSPVVALAPYWTTGVFLAGVGLLIRAWWYLVPAALFTATHTAHGMLSLGFT